MIALGSDFLVFRLASGESLPLSAEMVSADLMAGTKTMLEPEFVDHAASAVFYYYKEDLGRQTVTIGEFAQTLEKVLNGFKLERSSLHGDKCCLHVEESDLGQLADESGGACELLFFPRLRNELRQQLRQGPRVLRFRGLRCCVKRLAGAQRWSGRCQCLQDRIVEYLRECLSAERSQKEFALVVE
jgi:hypothetical protein